MDKQRAHDATPLHAVVIGGSAGAIDGLAVLLPGLPRDFPAPVLVVVHVPPNRKNALPDLFQSRCALQVKEAEDKEPLQPGVVYFAPPDYHLLVEPDGRLSLSSEEPVNYSRPSIDLLFESAAEALGPRVIGIVLSGASADGAAGLRAICRIGGIALVQHPDTAPVPIMPQAALKACPRAQALPLPNILFAMTESLGIRNG